MSAGRRGGRLTWRPVADSVTERPAPREGGFKRLTRNIGETLSRWLRAEIAKPVASPNGIIEAIRLEGLPSVAAPGVAEDPLDLTSALLDTGAELEHALMIEYLYAAASAADPGVARALARIAAQEMGHLATVQNLRLALGLPAYMGRQDLAPQPGQDPFPFKREPLSLDALAKYAAAERPSHEHVAPDLEALVTEILARANAAVGGAIPRVGTIYATLYWLFLPTDGTNAKPWPDFPEDVFRAANVPQLAATAFGALERQAEPIEWRASTQGLEVIVCDTGEAAVRAIYRIAAQGEGLANSVDSHFPQFVDLYRRMRDQGLDVHDVPVDPHVGGGAPSSEVDHPLAVAANAVLDAAYAALQIEILIVFTLTRTGVEAPLRRALISHLLSEGMLAAVAPLGRLLCSTLPRRAGQAADDGACAGAIFSPVQATSGDRAALLVHWKAAIDGLEAAVDAALQLPDDSGLLGGVLADITDHVGTKRTLWNRISNI